jgi:hypothetical protein
MEHDLTEELDVSIDIYDRKYFEQHANDNAATIAAFHDHLKPAVAFLDDLKGPSFPENAPIKNAQAVCAFLGQELERRIGTVKTLEGVCDGLILWALEGTDPDKQIFMSEDEIIRKVEGVIPTAKNFFRGQVAARLKMLCAKSAGLRQVNFHKKNNGYCLPYQTREAIRTNTLADEKLKLDMTASFVERLEDLGAAKLGNDVYVKIPKLLHTTLEKVFEQQGYDAARHFLDDEQEDAIKPAAVVEIAGQCVRNSDVKQKQREDVLELMKRVLSGVFYNSKEIERQYCSRLARTYILLFTIRNVPEVIEYFNTMAKSFELYVGTDMIVRAMSEYCLRPEDQMACNAFKIIKQAGSRLLLTEPTLEEVHSHIWASEREYMSTYHDIEQMVDIALASQSDRILIRAYYYAKLDKEPKRSKSWAQYIGNFLTYAKMDGPVSAASMQSLKDTLCARFGFEFVGREAMEKGISKDDLEKLTAKIFELRSGNDKGQEKVRARNDALHILRVNQDRVRDDKAGGNPFGYRSWWLTQEVKSGAAAAAVFPKRKHIRYIMRPEFLINYIAYNPTNAEVRSSLETIFPSLHGVRLGTRMNQKMLDKVIEKIRAAQQSDPARAQALLAEYGNELKAAQTREYLTKFD